MGGQEPDYSEFCRPWWDVWILYEVIGDFEVEEWHHLVSVFKRSCWLPCHVLVIYCYITKYPQTKGFKISILFCWQFYGLGLWEGLSWMVPFSSTWYWMSPASSSHVWCLVLLSLSLSSRWCLIIQAFFTGLELLHMVGQGEVALLTLQNWKPTGHVRAVSSTSTASFLAHSISQRRHKAHLDPRDGETEFTLHGGWVGKATM